MSVKKEPAVKKELTVKKERRAAGKKRTHRQMKASKFLDVEAKEEESEEDQRRTTKSEVKQESGKSSLDLGHQGVVMIMQAKLTKVTCRVL